MAKKETTPDPKKGKKLAVKKEALKDLDVKKDSAIKGGGTTGCSLTWKKPNC